MGTFKDAYDILKDLLAVAKKVKNMEAVQLAMDLQEKFFELREENKDLKDQLEQLQGKVNALEQANIIEEDLDYSARGFVLLKTDEKKIPYCSCCWKKERKLIPLSQYGNYYNYECGNCHSKIIVLDDNGDQIK